MRLFRLAALTAGAVLITLTQVASAGAQPPHTRVVHPGQSIQAALDAAAPGETIVVLPGTYRENIEITKDGTTLVGYGAVLAAPAVSQPRLCSDGGENPFGLCITGVTGAGFPPPVLKPARNITVRGLTVQRFESTGILAFGAENVRLEDVSSTGGKEYGVLFAITSGGTIVHSRITGGDEAGIYIGDSPRAGTVISGTEVDGSGLFGVFVRNSAHGRITGDRITGRCIGIGFLPTVPEAGVVADWSATGNLIHHNDGVCPPADGDEGDVTFAGTGVLMAGTARVTVRGNVITDNRLAPGTAAFDSGGIVLTSATAFGGPAEPVDNTVTGNLLHGNRPMDLNVAVAGHGNVVRGNRCGTSSPGGLCSH